MHISIIQLNITWEDKNATIQHVEQLLKNSTIPPSGLIVLPEMFATGFSMNVACISEDTESGITFEFLRSQAKLYNSYILAGLVTMTQEGLGKNEAILITPAGDVATRYCKIHPFTYGGENKCYISGDEVVTYPIGEFTIAPLICYDLRFPETFRTAVKRGATLFPVIANWPAAREEHWITLLKARAIENQAYVIGVNRCGYDPKIQYSGRSLIINPKGEVMADAGTEEKVLQSVLDYQSLQTYREVFPALNDIN